MRHEGYLLIHPLQNSDATSAAALLSLYSSTQWVIEDAADNFCVGFMHLY